MDLSFNSKRNVLGVALVLDVLLLSQVSAPAQRENPVTRTVTASEPKAQPLPDTLLLRGYHPQPIHKIPITEVPKAKYAAIDMHCHDYGGTPEGIAEWVKTMNEVNIRKTIVLSGATGERFDKIQEMYAKYPGRFDVWCGLDTSAVDEPDFGTRCAQELERCWRKGARGVGELVDKGSGFRSGVHSDDPRLAPVWQKCVELEMPVSLHVADPIWAYQPQDANNDGLMNSFRWRLDNKPNIVKFDGMIDILERTLKQNPKVIFIACHMANLDFDLNRLAKLMDAYVNLYADTSARFGEMAATPRASAAFLNKYAGRVVYGTDQQRAASMYRSSFRVLETLDEHFYVPGYYNYHWNLSGFGLPNKTLKKIYHDNAVSILERTKNP